jgi:hypothetical protein
LHAAHRLRPSRWPLLYAKALGSSGVEKPIDELQVGANRQRTLKQVKALGLCSYLRAMRRNWQHFHRFDRPFSSNRAPALHKTLPIMGKGGGYQFGFAPRPSHDAQMPCFPASGIKREVASTCSLNSSCIQMTPLIGRIVHDRLVLTHKSLACLKVKKRPTRTGKRDELSILKKATKTGAYPRTKPKPGLGPGSRGQLDPFATEAAFLTASRFLVHHGPRPRRRGRCLRLAREALSCCTSFSS